MCHTCPSPSHPRPNILADTAAKSCDNPKPDLSMRLSLLQYTLTVRGGERPSGHPISRDWYGKTNGPRYNVRGLLCEESLKMKISEVVSRLTRFIFYDFIPLPCCAILIPQRCFPLATGFFSSLLMIQSSLLASISFCPLVLKFYYINYPILLIRISVRRGGVGHSVLQYVVRTNPKAILVRDLECLRAVVAHWCNSCPSEGKDTMSYRGSSSERPRASKGRVVVQTHWKYCPAWSRLREDLFLKVQDLDPTK